MYKKSMVHKLAGLIFLFFAVVAAFIPDVALAAERQWDRGGDATSWSDPNNWMSGAPVDGDSLLFDNANLQDGDILVNDISHLDLTGITFTGSNTEVTNVYLGGNTIRLTGNITDNNPAGTVNIYDTNITATGTVRMIGSDFGFLAFYGLINLYNNNLGLRSYDDSIVYFNGSVKGSGSIIVSGTDTGDGFTAFGDFTNAIRPIVIKDGGYLKADGKTGSITVASTGNFVTEECVYTRNFTARGWFIASLGGDSQCSEYGRVNAVGKVDLSGATLSTKNSLIYSPAKGAKFILIGNDGTDPIVGQFANRAEGTKFKIGAYTFRLTYKGGSGNDLVLTRL